MSKLSAHRHATSAESTVVVCVSVLQAFPQCVRDPAFLALVRKHAAGRPLPDGARRPSLRAQALDLVAALWSALLDDCRVGIAIEDGVEGREVRFVGFLRYRLAPDRSWVRAALVGEPAERSESVDIGSPLPTWRWVAHALRRHRGLAEPMRASILIERSPMPVAADPAEESDAVLERIWHWAVACIEKLVRQQVDVRVLRRQLQDALDLDVGLLALARRVRIEQVNDVISDWYSTCGRFRHHLERVADKAPALLPVLGWLIRGNCLSLDNAPLAMLKVHFEALGASKQEWRRLLREPARPVTRLRTRGVAADALDLPLLMLVWTRLHRGLSDGDRLPIAMWETILRTCAGPLGERVKPLLSWPLRPELMRAGIERARAMAAAGLYDEFLRLEWSRVVAWAADYRNEGLRPRQRSWSSALRAAADVERAVRAWARGCDEYPWESVVADFEHGGLRARALITASDIVNEAIAMRHCADSYLLSCSSGESRLFRVEVVATGKHVATIALRRCRSSPPTDVWSLEQAKGFANQPPPPEIIALGGELVAEYQRRSAAVPIAFGC
jgi:hypothetical protein